MPTVTSTDAGVERNYAEGEAGLCPSAVHTVMRCQNIGRKVGAFPYMAPDCWSAVGTGKLVGEGRAGLERGKITLLPTMVT